MKLTLHRDNLALVLPPSLREEWKALCKRVDEKNGGYLSVDLQPPRRPRSTGELSQNHFINGAIQQICVETGNDFEDVKMYCKKQAIAHGYPFKKDNVGNIVYSMADGEPLPESEAKITVEEAKLLIDTILQVAGELGITLKKD